MNIYEVHHAGHYLGGFSVVSAESEAQAVELTKAAIAEHGLKPDGIKVTRALNVSAPKCHVLFDGDY